MARDLENDPFQEGWDAYMAGKKKKRNPYKKGTEPYDEWDNGWLECRAEMNDDPVQAEYENGQ